MHSARRAATRPKTWANSLRSCQSSSPARYTSSLPTYNKGPVANKANQIARNIRKSANAGSTPKLWQPLKLHLASLDEMPPDAQKIPDVVSPLTGKAMDVFRLKDSLVFKMEHDAARRCTVEMLRDACSCHLCRDPHSGQKSFSSTEIPTGIEILEARTRQDGGLVVTINKDMERIGADRGHDILLEPDYVAKLMHPPLKRYDTAVVNARRYHVDHWDKNYIQKNVRKISYEEFMQPESTAFWDAIQDIMRLGLVFLKDVPRDEHSVVRITERINCIRETFYGRTFDVKAKPNAENVAYTSGYLGLHQDLLYLAPMPYIQILHCMDNGCEGGESLFADADRIGRIFQHLPAQYQPLVHELINFNVPYAYTKDGYKYQNRRPVLDINPKGMFRAVRWSPPFQAEIDQPERLDTWIAAARVFEKAVNHPSAMYQTRMNPGECVIFNNQRVLHGRTAFDSSVGSRWLRGAYMSYEDFWSKASHAPTTHAASTKDFDSWWDVNKANAQLQETETAEQIKGWLDQEVKGLRKYQVKNGAGSKRKGGVMSERMDRLVPSLTERMDAKEPPEW